jgi:integrase
LLPLLVLGAFAGLRTSEIQKQLWTDIDLARGWITVTDVKGNTPQNRLVPITDNLKQWLGLCQREYGVCCDYPRPEEAIMRLAKRAGVPWKRNALRHSYISYRIAETGDVPRVSLECGNSPHMIHRHYRKPLTPGDAKAWFAIVPQRAENITPMPAAAGAAAS